MEAGRWRIACTDRGSGSGANSSGPPNVRARPPPGRPSAFERLITSTEPSGRIARGAECARKSAESTRSMTSQLSANVLAVACQPSSVMGQPHCSYTTAAPGRGWLPSVLAAMCTGEPNRPTVRLRQSDVQSGTATVAPRARFAACRNCAIAARPLGKTCAGGRPGQERPRGASGGVAGHSPLRTGSLRPRAATAILYAVDAGQ